VQGVLLFNYELVITVKRGRGQEAGGRRQGAGGETDTGQLLETLFAFIPMFRNACRRVLGLLPPLPAPFPSASSVRSVFLLTTVWRINL